MGVTVDFKGLYAELDATRVTIDFNVEHGHAAIREKLAEIISKTLTATDVLLRVMKLRTAARQEVEAQHTLYAVTGTPDHKTAEREARGVLDDLKTAERVAALSRRNLRDLEDSIRLYSRILDQEMFDGGRGQQGPAQRGLAVPSALSSLAGEVGEEIDTAGLFPE